MDEFNDVERKLAGCEQRRDELEALLADLTDFVENGSMPLHWVNGSGIIIWVNKAELDMLGYKKEEYVGLHISKFHADAPVIEDILTRLINKETICNYPARLKCKNGQIKHVLINSNVQWKGGQFLHTRCFTRDISELKQSESEKVSLINTLLEENRALKHKVEQLSNHDK